MTEKKLSYADKPWLKSYKTGPYKLAHTLDLENHKMPVYKILDNSAAEYATHVAIIFQGKKILYEELKLYTDKLATALADLGVKKGDRVAAMMPNCPQLIISEFGIMKTGGVFVPISPLNKAPEVQHQLSESGAEVMIIAEGLLELVNSIKGETKLREIITTSLKDYTAEEEAEIKEIPGTRSLRKLIAEYEATPPEIEIDVMEDLAVLGFTGGATGVPKGVMRTHLQEVAACLASTPWNLKPIEAGIKGKASLLIPMPIYHGAGCTVTNQAFYMGLRLILMPDPRDTDAILAAIHEYRPFIIMAVPTQLMRLVQKKVGRMSSLVSAGAAPLPRETAELWKKETGMPVAQVYGMTEGGNFSNLSTFSKLTGFAPLEKWAIGVPCPDLEVKLVDDNGEEVPVGEVGELRLRGPMIMKGYWPTPGKGIEDGWITTGDLARMDEDGYFYLEDRVKDMINVSGLKVYSPVVDDALFKHPSVAMAVAIGIPDPDTPGSERVKAFIKLKDGYEGKITADDIITHCRSILPPYAAPKFVEFREDLPLTATEKLFKRALRDEEIAKMKARGELK